MEYCRRVRYFEALPSARVKSLKQALTSSIHLGLRQTKTMIRNTHVDIICSEQSTLHLSRASYSMRPKRHWRNELVQARSCTTRIGFRKYVKAMCSVGLRQTPTQISIIRKDGSLSRNHNLGAGNFLIVALMQPTNDRLKMRVCATRHFEP